ncbi:MAG: M28 family peptidase [Paeniclostridium sordellii]|nr:M28 family peptidase [Paeniclostridium sordellii]
MSIEELICEIKNNYQVRFDYDEKKNFRDYIKTKLESMYYIKLSESGNDSKIKNLYTDIEGCDVILTAHYDTPRSIPKDLMIISKYIKTTNKYIVIASFIPIIIFAIIKPLIPATLAVIILMRLLISNKNKNNYNDNTSGIISLLYLIDKFKKSKIESENNNKEYSEKIGFIFFDYEERSFKGSKKFNKYYGSVLKDKIFINLDCVGGIDNTIMISPRDKNYKNNNDYKDIIYLLKYQLEKADEFKDKNVHIKPKHSKSDYLKIKSKVSLGISNEEMYKCGYYIPNIHTYKDNKDNIDDNFIKKFTDKLHIVIYKYLDIKYSKSINLDK